MRFVLLFAEALCLMQIVQKMLGDKEAQQACKTYITERASRGLRSLGVARSFDKVCCIPGLQTQHQFSLIRGCMSVACLWSSVESFE